MNDHVYGELDAFVKSTLTDFAAWVARTRWYGREREAVNAYVMGFLVPNCRDGSVLRSPAQVGIEVAVPQHAGPGRKRVVCKDLVLWSSPFETTWDGDREPTRHPLCIIEWKRASCAHEATTDLEWLRAYSLQHTHPFVGYSVVFDPDATEAIITVGRAAEGTQRSQWFTAP